MPPQLSLKLSISGENIDASISKITNKDIILIVSMMIISFADLYRRPPLRVAWGRPTIGRGGRDNATDWILARRGKALQ